MSGDGLAEVQGDGEGAPGGGATLVQHGTQGGGEHLFQLAINLETS